MPNDESNIKNIALYTRVSTEDQAREGFSLEAQLEKLRAYCFSQDYNIAGEYIDEGYSGTNIKRPQYQRMFEDMDKWEGILVMKMDRIHRNRLNFISMMAQLKQQDKEFVSMTESLNTSTAMGRFVMGIIQDIAQLESEQIGERTFTGMGQKAKDIDSGFMGHGVPFGYKAVVEFTDDRYPSGKKKTKSHLEPIPEKLDLVKQGFELADQGKSINEITRKLGINYGTVHYFLHNPYYAGFERWCNKLKKTKTEPIISGKLFNRVQVKISKKICNPNARSKPLQLPLDDTDYFEIPIDQLSNISSIRYKRFKHPVV